MVDDKGFDFGPLVPTSEPTDERVEVNLGGVPGAVNIVNPRRGPTRPLDPGWMNLDYIKPRDFSDAGIVVMNEQQNMNVVPPETEPLLLSYDLQLIDTVRNQTRTLFETHLLRELSPEDTRTQMRKVFDDWVNSTFGKDRSFFVRMNYGRVPSKRAGRKGTRRAWKKAHPPKLVKWVWIEEGVLQSSIPIRRINHTVTIDPKGIKQ